MATTASSCSAASGNPQKKKRDDAASPPAVSPLLKLPRELRDQIYHACFRMQDDRSGRALRIERRNLKYFEPSAAAILLVLHHEYFLLNHQVAQEALEALFKHHTVFLNCGPFVLKSLLERIEQQHGLGRQWLKWIKRIELDWGTFPSLKRYPSNRKNPRHIDHAYDEYDPEGSSGSSYYDDNFYEPSNTSLYPSYTNSQAASSTDPFSFANQYPFTDHSQDPAQDGSAEDKNLDLLISNEVTPLFSYLASPTFNLTSITIPLYFRSPGYALPVKIRYWVQVCAHALLLLTPFSSTTASPPLQEVRIHYLPWDIWASMNPADDLHRMVKQGIWFDEPEDGEGGERGGESEVFRAIWAGMTAKAMHEERGAPRMGLDARVSVIPWNGHIDSEQVGDGLEVVFTRAATTT